MASDSCFTGENGSRTMSVAQMGRVQILMFFLRLTNYVLALLVSKTTDVP